MAERRLQRPEVAGSNPVPFKWYEKRKPSLAGRQKCPNPQPARELRLGLTRKVSPVHRQVVQDETAISLRIQSRGVVASVTSGSRKGPGTVAGVGTHRRRS